MPTFPAAYDSAPGFGSCVDYPQVTAAARAALDARPGFLFRFPPLLCGDEIFGLCRGAFWGVLGGVKGLVRYVVKLVEVEGFEQGREVLAFDPAHGVGIVGIPGHQHEAVRQVRPAGAGKGQHIPAVHVGQNQALENQVELPRLDRVNRGLAAQGLRHDGPFLAKDIRQEVEDGFVHVTDQDGSALERYRFGRHIQNPYARVYAAI